jgi:hypothetical protein
VFYSVRHSQRLFRFIIYYFPIFSGRWSITIKIPKVLNPAMERDIFPNFFEGYGVDLEEEKYFSNGW